MRLDLRVFWKGSEGTLKHRGIQLRQERVVVGHFGADIVLSDREVSTSHALFYEGLQGELRVCDLQSGAGTFLDGEKIIDRAVAPGTELRIGPYSVLVESFSSSPQVTRDQWGHERQEPYLQARTK